MDKSRIAVQRGRWSLVAGTLLVAVVLASAPCWSQMGGGRGPLLSTEESKAAWAMQAGHAAQKLELGDDAAKQLAQAYEAARTSYAAAIDKKREELRGVTEDRSARWAAYRKMYTEVGTAEREKFEAALAAFLSEGQAKKAVDMLGVFSTRGDHMVHLLAGYELGDQQGKALDLINTYVLEQNKLWENVSGQETDVSAQREKMTALKSDLDKGLAAILSEEQLAKWKEATTFRRGGGQGGGGRGRGGERGGGQGGGGGRRERSDQE